MNMASESKEYPCPVCGAMTAAGKMVPEREVRLVYSRNEGYHIFPSDREDD